VASRRQQSPIGPGSRAPEFRLPRLDGGESTLADLTAQGHVLLAFFKVTCPVCQMAFPYLERLHAAGYPVAGISQNDALDTREFNQEFGINFPTLLDSEDSGFAVSNDYGIANVPTLFLVRAGGLIDRMGEGWMKSEMEQYAAEAGAVLFQPGDRVPEMKPG
jgi:cytochrome c biogenesis protein CcmG, thiol:disulfide interchange protein DsbE